MKTIQVPTSLRKAETEVRYQNDKIEGKTKDLRDEPAILERYGWRLIANSYPYDMVFNKHDMLIPLRGQGIDDPKLHQLLFELRKDYDFWFVNFPHRQSIKHLFHVHLVTHKPREEMSLC